MKFVLLTEHICVNFEKLNAIYILEEGSAYSVMVNIDGREVCPFYTETEEDAIEYLNELYTLLQTISN